MPLPFLAQTIRIERLSADPGLSQNTINCLLQDRKGFIWVGTEDGLSRFDGYGFVHFKNHQDDLASISNNIINAICEDHEGFIWVATNNGLNRFDPKTECFQRFFNDPARPGSLSSNRVYSVFEDKAGKVWVGASSTLDQMERASGTFKHYPLPISPPRFVADNAIKAITEWGGDLLVATWGSGVWRFRQPTKTFVPVLHDAPQQITSKWVENVWTDAAGACWAIINGFAFQYDVRNNRFHLLETTTGRNSKDYTTSLFRVSSSQLLVGTSGNGLKICGSGFHEIKGYYLPDPDTTNSNYITAILRGNGGEFWLGTRGNGLFLFNPDQHKFQVFSTENGLPGVPDFKNVSGVAQTASGDIWITSRTHGIAVFDPKSERFSLLNRQQGIPKGLKTDHQSCVFEDSKGRMWVGTWGKGVFVYDKNSGALRQYISDAARANALSDNFVTSICESEDHKIWIATVLGVSVIGMNAAESGVFKNYRFEAGSPKGLSHFQANVVFCDRAGNIWIGTGDGGLNLYLPAEDAFRHFMHNPTDPNALGSSRVVALFEDHKNRLWVGTWGGGLHRYEPNTQRFVHYTEKEGLPNGTVLGIVEDARGFLWLTTNRGLSKFDPEQGSFDNYFEQDGLPSNQFSPQTITICHTTGKIMAWGKNGVVLFHPDSIRRNAFVPPVVLASLTRYVTTERRTAAVRVAGISARHRIELPFSENTLTFEFAALNFRRSLKNQYAFKLEGMNKDWTNLGTQRSVTFSNLPPGHYTLWVKGSNNDGVWNEQGVSLQVIILPPWYRSWWAYLLYALALGMLIYGWRSKEWKEQRLRQRLEQEQWEAGELKKLDRAKSHLYTNISHEFRTPLTVILGMVGQIEQNPQTRLHEGLDLIRRSGQNLLALINQMLDLAKLESNEMPVRYVQGDIVAYLKYVKESFQSMAESKGVVLQFSSEPAAIVMDYDPEKVQQILSNLLTNAIKFTPPGGTVEIFIRQPSTCILLKVVDTGIGIPPEQLPHIFDRFYQADSSSTRRSEGTGIGLALTLELVRVLRGHISVESTQGQGSTFTVQIPVTQTAPMAAAGVPLPLLPPLPSSPAPESKSAAHTDKEQPLLLLVEDNPDVRTFLVRLLEPDYRLATATNGQAGIEQALEIVPDMIISDVMMAEKDGFELCDALKNDQRTSHIPILLLTARAEAAARLEGLRRGADAYLSKPFHEEELRLLVAQQLLLRRRLQARYAALQPPDPVADNAIPDTGAFDAVQEDTFFTNVLDAADARLSDSGFGGEELARAVFLSLSQLNRKLNALTGKSSVQLLRELRLRRAKELLRQTDMSVTAVALATGFNDASYFARVFTREVGVAPSEWRSLPD